MRIGFLVWNAFQFYHFRSVLSALPEATLFIDMRPGLHRRFPFDILAGLKNPVVTLRDSKLAPVAERADVLVVQSNTEARTQLPGVRLAAMQYSLSKEWHQYGRWMQEADLALCFGDYSQARIETDARVVPVGNPRMDDYFAGRLDPRILARLERGLDPAKPTLMFAPSWNDDTMNARLKAARRKLSARYNILWSPHHNTRIFRGKLLKLLTRDTLAYDRYLYYLKLCDILVSDTSGALFDALHAGKRVIITDFDPDAHERRDSIEFTMRDSIGPVARNEAEIGSLADRLLSGGLDFSQGNAALKTMCFCCDGDAAARAAEALRAFAQ